MTSEDRIPQPLIWPSVARLAATGAIFVFHFLGLLEYDQYALDFYAILTYCFLSGYLARINKGARLKWGITRYFRIMIPYWLVIIPVVLANEVVQYKTVTWIEDTVTIFGGNLFLENPPYVIAWYITFVLILYAYAIIESFFRSYSLVICMILGAVAFGFWLGQGYYFLAFVVGLRLSRWWRPEYPIIRVSWLSRYSSQWLFVAQRYCYSFFLVHGAVLLFFVKKTSISENTIFIASFFLSSVLSVVIYRIGKPIQMLASSKGLKLTDKTLGRFSTA
jgi:hypothetical protein